MTDLEHDLELSLEWWTPNPCFEDDAEVDCEETAKNLTELGYQKIVWHDAKKELPELNKYVLGYCASDNTYAVVKWDCVDWSDDNEVCYNVDYWTELPKINLEK
ncbi:hypothetical protein [Intestinibacter sp.]|uniref:hypothetical protein n=1 Tax=Intestinibacter sp. TaxID=1965304 RepID=UPI002A764208|nr:hypothetical protein [Intestinibacter sp.]MDY2735882.1 hypothetical protein [Intestinibacter sp.]